MEEVAFENALKGWSSFGKLKSRGQYSTWKGPGWNENVMGLERRQGRAHGMGFLWY